VSKKRYAVENGGSFITDHKLCETMNTAKAVEILNSYEAELSLAKELISNLVDRFANIAKECEQGLTTIVQVEIQNKVKPNE
jgi:tRNA isopentenyl-2-thiomethyl-A-37 hydroxylase MiaE